MASDKKVVPTIGRIVLFKPNEGPEMFPAIITKVHTPELLNLTVFIETGHGVQIQQKVEQGEAKGEWQWPSVAPAKAESTEVKATGGRKVSVKSKK